MKHLEDFDGIGNGIFGEVSNIDIYNCIDETCKLSKSAEDIPTLCKAHYIETSPSGRVIRIIFLTKNLNFDKGKYYINSKL